MISILSKIFNKSCDLKWELQNLQNHINMKRKVMLILIKKTCGKILDSENLKMLINYVK